MIDCVDLVGERDREGFRPSKVVLAILFAVGLVPALLLVGGIYIAVFGYRLGAYLAIAASY